MLPPARTAGNLHWQNLIQSTATSHRTYFRCQTFKHRQERSTWKPITCVPLIGFYSRAIQPCAFQEVSAKHRRGLSQSLALGRGAGSMKGVHVTHGSGSKFLHQCLLDVHLKLCCLARLAVLLAPASQINYSIAAPAFRDLPWKRAEGKEAFSEHRWYWVGREGQAPCLCFIERLCKREYCIRNRRLCLISPSRWIGTH